MTGNSLLSVIQASTRVVGGLGEVAIAQARTSVQDNVTRNPLLSLGVQLAGLVEDLLAGARTDPNMVLDLVRAEVERSVTRLGFATTAEVDALKRRIDDLQRELLEAEGRGAEHGASSGSVAPDGTAATSKKAPPQGGAGRRSPVPRGAAKKTAATSVSSRPRKTGSAPSVTNPPLRNSQNASVLDGKPAASATRPSPTKRPTAAKKSATAKKAAPEKKSATAKKAGSTTRPVSPKTSTTADESATTTSTKDATPPSEQVSSAFQPEDPR